MRLWHQYILPFLPTKWLMGQHRDCCALRGRGVVDPSIKYVFDVASPFAALYKYHMVVINLLASDRGIDIDPRWRIDTYRGKSCPPVEGATTGFSLFRSPIYKGCYYKQHDDSYLRQCIDLLGRRRCFEKGRIAVPPEEIWRCYQRDYPPKATFTSSTSNTASNYYTTTGSVPGLSSFSTAATSLVFNPTTRRWEPQYV